MHGGGAICVLSPWAMIPSPLWLRLEPGQLWQTPLRLAVSSQFEAHKNSHASGQASVNRRARKSRRWVWISDGFNPIPRGDVSPRLTKPYRNLLGRYHARPGVSLASRTPISMGFDGGDRGRPNPRIVAGLLTPDQVWLATVGVRQGAEFLCP